MLAQVTIVGVGLIGGSLAIAFRERGIARRIVGVDSNEANRKVALERGLVDEFMELSESFVDSDLVVLAVPVNYIPLLAIKILNSIHSKGLKCVVMDMGSTKEELSDAISLHPARGRFVTTHPMWGTEFSGPEAAVSGAFEGRTAVICSGSASDADAHDLVVGVYQKLGMILTEMESEEHDIHAAYVSHISHITSFALALTVLEKEREQQTIFNLAGGGFESTVRLAKSAASMWVPIIMENKYNVLDVLRENIHQLQVMRKMIEKDDREGLTQAIEKANEIRKIID
ncbi:MAG: prephenate dehydrogenase [Rikenellaceae bacterium]